MDRRLRRLAEKRAEITKGTGREISKHNEFTYMQTVFQERFMRDTQERMDLFEQRYGRRPTTRERDKIEAEVERELVPEMEVLEQDYTRVVRGRRGRMDDRRADAPPDWNNAPVIVDQEEEDDLNEAPPTAPPVPRNDINALIQDFMG